MFETQKQQHNSAVDIFSKRKSFKIPGSFSFY